MNTIFLSSLVPDTIYNNYLVRGSYPFFKLLFILCLVWTFNGLLEKWHMLYVCQGT